ncbi:MAG TPA: NAD(P)/FAD-dependent oxidoreductase [Exilispira sp.]|nr:NAD(P)/FAD-dependent oxidoreductase [Exilispira sp.]
MSKKILIIGAGIAGLSAACYARMNGYEAEVYEMHDKPGGLCTSWKRKDYIIDGCIHWLVGSSPDSSFYKFWKEVSAINGRKMIYHEVFYRFIDSEGKTFNVYCDADKLEKHLKQISPEDSQTIETFCNLIRKFSRFKMPIEKPYELYNFFDILKLIIKMMPYFKDMNFCNGITVGEFAQRFKNPFLREVFPKILSEKDYPLFSLVITLASLHSKDGGFPEGGSLNFAKAIEQKSISLGAKIFYKSKVERILEENGRAIGLQLSDGSKVFGDYIISAADLKTTLYDMLSTKHIDPLHQELFQRCKLLSPMVQVAFGINRQFSSQIESLGEFYKVSSLKDWNTDWLIVKNYSFDKSLAGPDKSVVLAGFSVDDYEYWEKLYLDKNAYKTEKEKIASTISDELEKIYPGFKDAIEIIDVATPVTYNRYTGNFKGTFMTWIITPDKQQKFRSIPKKVPNLDNFWLSGMWVQPPGGLPSALMSSRQVIQFICHKDKKKFCTSIK